MYSSISVGDPASSWLLILIGYILIAGSYIFHHKKLKAASLSSSTNEPSLNNGSTNYA
jgi:hypothetical protein